MLFYGQMPNPDEGTYPVPEVDSNPPPNTGFHQGSSLVAQVVKHLPAIRETRVQSLGWEDSLEKEMATHSSTLAWKIPRTERSLVGYSPWGRKESDTTERLYNQGSGKIPHAAEQPSPPVGRNH